MRRLRHGPRLDGHILVGAAIVAVESWADRSRGVIAIEIVATPSSQGERQSAVSRVEVSTLTR